MRISTALAVTASFLLVAACGQSQDDAADGDTAAAITPGPAVPFPASSESDPALAKYAAGWAAWDVQRFNEANEYFLEAAAADRSFAMAHLMAALSAPSTERFASNLRNAADNVAGATEGEKLLVSAYQKALDGDQEGQIAAIREALERHPNASQIWVLLGFALNNVNDAEGSREAFARSIELDPTLVNPHMLLGNSYLFQDPKDYVRAEKLIKQAVELAPDEPAPYDFMGDLHRAQGRLEAAYDDYTRAAELAPNLGAPLQQRGHVNSFLGNFDEARSDYTRSAEIETERGTNNGPFFLVFRAYVSIHEGLPESAIDELVGLSESADTWDMDGVADLKANALSSAALVAIHYGMSDTAQDVIDEMAEVLRAQAEDVGTEGFRDAQEATISYWQGMLAARMGDAAAASEAAAEFETHVASSNNPRKLERMHEILGMSAYQAGDFDAAVEHLSKGDHLNNMYTKYHLALAQEGAGNADEANVLLGELAVWNFNGPGYALTRADVLSRLESGAA